MARATCLIALTALALGGLSACGEDEQQLQVVAAASLRAPFTELAEQFEDDHPGVTVDVTYSASSATFAQQALDGADGDVIATGDTSSMAGASDALDGQAQIFASDVLVMVVASDASTELADVVDGASYAACVTTAACGQAWAALQRGTGVRAEPTALEVTGAAVVEAVTSGTVDAGFVYRSEAAAAGDAVRIVDVPDAEARAASYPIAVLRQSRDADLAREFVDLVLSADGREVLETAGFGTP